MKFLIRVRESSIPGAFALVALATAALALVLWVGSSSPAHAQGSGVGTLPALQISPGSGPVQFVSADHPQRLETTWISGGLTHTVTTDRHDNETPDAWARRHRDAVRASVSTFPPDQPQPHATHIRTWIVGDTIFTSWTWVDAQTGLLLPTLMSTERFAQAGMPAEGTGHWKGRHVGDLKVCLLEMPRA